MIAQKMDGFKQSVLNQDTFDQKISRQTNGKSGFITKYYNALIKDTRLLRMI